MAVLLLPVSLLCSYFDAKHPIYPFCCSNMLFYGRHEALGPVAAGAIK